MKAQLTICFVGVLLAVCGGVGAADLQAKTVDGQVIQGEYLGTENNIVRLKTSYGIVTIPSKDIVTLTAVSLPDRPKPAEGVVPVLPPPAAEQPVKLDALMFREPKGVQLASLLAARMPPIPEATKQNRVELFRLVRNFGDSSDSARVKIIRNLSNIGLMAYPFVEGAYTLPGELEDKVELIQALAGAHRPYNAGIFATVHAEVMSEMARVASEPPSLPPEQLSLKRTAPTRMQRLRIMARNARAIEGYAAMSGGPFNALLLMGYYKERYAGQSDPLLKDIFTDRARLAAVCGDYKVPAAAWQPEDRRLMIEMAFPMYFKENEDLHDLGDEVLKKLLPDKHPKWTAPQPEWFEWWNKVRDDLK